MDHINTIFRQMNIHNYQLFWCSPGFWATSWHWGASNIWGITIVTIEVLPFAVLVQQTRTATGVTLTWLWSYIVKRYLQALYQELFAQGHQTDMQTHNENSLLLGMRNAQYGAVPVGGSGSMWQRWSSRNSFRTPGWWINYQLIKKTWHKKMIGFIISIWL